MPPFFCFFINSGASPYGVGLFVVPHFRAPFLRYATERLRCAAGATTIPCAVFVSLVFKTVNCTCPPPHLQCFHKPSVAIKSLKSEFDFYLLGGFLPASIPSTLPYFKNSVTLWRIFFMPAFFLKGLDIKIIT